MEYLCYKYSRSIPDVCSRPQVANNDISSAQLSLDKATADIAAQDELENAQQAVIDNPDVSGVKRAKAVNQLQQLRNQGRLALNQAMESAKKQVRNAAKRATSQSQGRVWWSARVLTEQSLSGPQRKKGGAKKVNLLFLCTGNSCRSQMAEGFARAFRSDVINAYSAGIETHGLNPRAVAVMKEAGVDISSQRSQNVREFKNTPLDVVVTVCDSAAESCPTFPGRVKKVHSSFQDPPKLAKNAKTEEEALGHYRRVRDEVKKFVLSLPGSLNL